MARKVLKYSIENLDNDGVCILSIPINSEILTIRKQNDKTFLWALADNDLPKENRSIIVVGTGMPMDGLGDLIYIDAVEFIRNDTSIIMHFFEIL